MTSSTYREKMIVDASSSDFQRNMTCAGMLRAAQTIASNHCDAAGYGDDYLAANERVWILTKAKIDIVRCPQQREAIVIETTAYAPDRILYPRVTRFLSKDGAELASVDSIWVLVDTAVNRIVRKAPEDMHFPFAQATEDKNFKLPPRRDCKVVEEIGARYSMVDANGHVNNAVYADIVENALEKRLFAGEAIRQMMIAFHREAKPMARLTIDADGEDARVYLTGMVEGALCFEAAVEFVK